MWIVKDRTTVRLSTDLVGTEAGNQMMVRMRLRREESSDRSHTRTLLFGKHSEGRGGRRMLYVDHGFSLM
jgi:hypothetical protein